MRRIGFSLCLVALAVGLIGAAPARIPTPPKPVAKPVAASGLRGAQTANTPAKPAGAPAPLASPTPLQASDASAISTDSGQCRQACAHAYYFCLAGENAPSCPQDWSTCLIGCSQPPIQSQTTTP